MMSNDMSWFMIVFLDGKSVGGKSFNYSMAKVMAAYNRAESGCRTHNELTVNDAESGLKLESRLSSAGDAEHGSVTARLMCDGGLTNDQLQAAIYSMLAAIRMGQKNAGNAGALRNAMLDTLLAEQCARATVPVSEPIHDD